MRQLPYIHRGTRDKQTDRQAERKSNNYCRHTPPSKSHNGYWKGAAIIDSSSFSVHNIAIKYCTPDEQAFPVAEAWGERIGGKKANRAQKISRQRTRPAVK